MENQPIKPSPEEKDIDLGVLFKIFIEIAHTLASALRRLVRRLLNLLIWFLVFLRKRVLLLVVGLLLGLIPGFYIYLIKGPRFYSLMTVKVNFQSAHNLYNKVDYFNSLIQMHENKKLAALFNISDEDADKLVRFEIRAIDDDIQAIELYKKYFYDPQDYARVVREGQLMLTRDSAWSNIIRFRDFKNKLSFYDYPLQQVKLVSKLPSGYGAIEAGFVAAVSGNEALQRRKLISDSVHQEQARVIRSSLSNADSLMKAFAKQVAAGGRTESNATLTLSAKQGKSPETEVFDETIKLNNEFGRLQQQHADQLNVLDVYADLNDRGTYMSPFKESFLDYSLWCLLGAFIISLLWEAYSAIDKLEKKKMHA
ncbi:MAG TPA: hypothetical protein VHC48_12845 [Puia sp.]|nr:hypothetical protein [Puia sp.]